MFYRYKQFRAEMKKHPSKGAWRYFLRWKNALKEGAGSVKDQQAWITFKAIDFLNRHLNNKHKVFEYGGGGSTLFFLNRVKEVVTVEHNEEWFTILQQIINKKAVNHWKGKLIKAEHSNLVEPPDMANPAHYSSEDKASQGLNYKSYATAIDAYPDAYFDCVLVDGRSRPACIVHSVPKLKSGGFLVLDNSDREYYLTQTKGLLEEQFNFLFGEFGPSPYSHEFTHTSIWQKK